MCLGIPMKVLTIDRAAGQAEGLVEAGGLRRKANFSLLRDVKVGDYVLLHAGFAIERIKPGEAKKTIRALKALSVALVTLLVSAPLSLADTDAPGNVKTAGYLNGRAIMQFMDGGDTGRYYATQFIAGALEGMTAINGGQTIKSIYPDQRREDVIRAVIEYYMKNPDKRYRPVVDVILSGCK